MTLPVRYKVVMPLVVGTGTKYFSCFIRGHVSSYVARPGNPAVEYPLKGWAEAPIGGLLVFTSLANAEDFAGSHPIFRCYVREQVKLPPYRTPYPYVRYSLLQYIWNQESVKRIDVLVSWPPGTEAWRKVKLIEKVTL